MSKKTITIIVEDGMIQDILDIPDDIEIRLQDYDCDQECDGDDPRIQKDEDGEYWLSTFESGA